MNIKSKKILLISIISILSIMIMPNMAQAGLQGNKGGTALTSVSMDGFFISIRKMESQYGTLGKNANMQETTFLDTSGNGIDCHMSLSTEFGTTGILAYSEYGAIPTNSKDTTTGNSSGIYQMAYNNIYEFVAGIVDNASTNEGSLNDHRKVIYNADNRYSNKYGNLFAGDAIGKFGTSLNYPSFYKPVLVRGGSGGIFNTLIGSSSGNSTYSSRAVVVCGTGL